MPDDGKKKVRLGHRVSADKVKKEECESAGQMAGVHEKNQSKLKVDANTQERVGMGGGS